ncbi:MAG: hypothetical protein J5477_06105 [Schwartzia sp.]|nr:hypothetical protein [Schwartzia sp. (in: firmicutes)]
MQDALDGAINYASGGMFQNEEDLRTRFLSDMAGGGDLLGLCGIDLTNKDTGAITGSDAGGEKEKTAESIVPEEKNPYTGGVPSGTTNINGLSVTWPATGGDSAKEAIATALDSQWLKNCMDLIQESYELNFKEPGTSVNSMEVILKDEGDNHKLAYVTSGSVGGVTDSLTLTVNMYYYGSLDPTDVNGKDTGTGAGQQYLDRTIAHEMTHALMAANIKNFGELAKKHPYITEGMAELVHGIDDVRKTRIEELSAASGATRLKNALNYSGDSPDNDVYAAGYMILRYLAKQAADAEPEKRMVFQTGTKANQAIKVGLADMRAEALGLVKNGKVTCQVTTQKKATAALNVIDRAITKAIKQQTSIGAVQSRLDFTAQNIITANENVTASESTIRDADMARAFTDYTKANVLMQTAQSMLAQANQTSSNVLSLLQ